MQTVSERFLRYVTFGTQSDELSETCPSTDSQRIFGEVLVEEMRAMGIADARMDADGYIYGTVPGDPALPTIGLIAHMDTSPETSGENVKPRVVKYEGGDVLLNPQQDIWLRAEEYPSLSDNKGKHLIVTDGTTLLGADDKAGIAEILSAAEFLLRTRMSHATLKISFTPDEEIGRGADRFDVEKFGADYAYTVDGGTLGEIEYENFNAAGATVEFRGLNIHPGAAKDKMVNSQLLAMEFQSLLPIHQRPECTEGYEGFFHLIGMEGNVEHSVLRYIIRDHDMEKFLEKEPCMHIVERAKDAMRAVGLEPKVTPIRGGTDGARLSFMGLPCPNLFTGGQNFHGRFEYIPVEDMEACVNVLVQILTMA